MANALEHSRSRIPGLVNPDIFYIPVQTGIIILNGYTGSNPGASTMSITGVTVGEETDQIMLVLVGNTDTVNSVEWLSENLTLFDTGAGSIANVSIWYMINPPTGTSSIGIQCNANSYIEAAGFLISGVNQTTPLSDFQTANGISGNLVVNTAGTADSIGVSIIKYWDNVGSATVNDVDMEYFDSPSSDGSWQSAISVSIGSTSIIHDWIVATDFNAVLGACTVNPV